MKHHISRLARRYRQALCEHLKKGRPATLALAHGLGDKALAIGLQTLDLAKLHEQTLIAEVLPGRRARARAALIKKAGVFFAAAILPKEHVRHAAPEETSHLKQAVESLSRRSVELAAANLELSWEIEQRKAAEEALKKSERHYSKLLSQSDRLQEQLRQLSRQILSAQEDERKRISRELHDVIGQTLTGINLRLASLKKEAAISTRGLERKIASAQRLVEKSVNLVHRFALELRPAVLDDIGLIPALHSFMKSFIARTGIRTSLTAFAGVEQLDMSRRTALFRVAQEALTNVVRHARANRVMIDIRKIPEGACMTIQDDGRSFDVERTLHSSGSKRLGLLGMRERLEMVGGSFAIESAPGSGTTIIARMPTGTARRKTRQEKT